MNIEKINEIQLEKNNRLSLILKMNGISKLVMTSLGNSIASGYSMTRMIKPLLMRNETLEKMLLNQGIILERHSFARAQNNSDEHIYDWVMSNVKESDMNKRVRIDYNGGATSLPTAEITEERINEYYPTKLEDDKGLIDIISESDENLANIVVYNGCTGSFLDNVTRGGKIRHMLTYGLKRDIKGLEATLKYIQGQNRTNGNNTQVYLCGAPNWLGIHLTDILNRKLKKIAKEYANVTYVDSVPSKFFYKKIKDDSVTDANVAQQILSNIPLPDPHYDETEYLKFNNNIIEAINNNFTLKKVLINVDRNLYRASMYVEQEGKEEYRNKEFQDMLISKAIDNEIDLLKDSINSINNINDINEYKKIISKYISNRFPYDFYYLGKGNLKDNISRKFSI